MFAPIVVGVLSFILSLGLMQFRYSNAKIFVVFLPVFVFLALRYNYGNDYLGYLGIFEDIASRPVLSYEYEEFRIEIGWLALNRIFAVIGFFPMIAFLAFVNCYLLGRFVRRFVSARYYWVAVLIYIFFPGNMLIQASAMRQTVAIGLFLLAVEFLVDRRAIAYSVCMAIAMLFHTSVGVLFPIYLIGDKRIHIRPFASLILILLYALVIIFSKSIVSFLLGSLEVFGVFDRYAVYEAEGVISSGLGILLNFANLLLLLYFHDKQSFDVRVVFRVAIFGLYVSAIAISLEILGRMAFYFSVISMVTVPLIFISIRGKYLKIIYLMATFAGFMYMYIQFFSSPIYGPMYRVYDSILSQF